MSQGIYVSLSQQMVLRKRMDAIAQNLANMNTDSFRAERVLFQEYVHKTPSGGVISFVHEVGLHRDPMPGRLERTGSDLDLAIKGTGYFVVENEIGDRYYTRHGHFELDDERNLVTSSGHRVLGLENVPISVVDGRGQITIARDGTVSVGDAPVGRVRVVEFDDEQALAKAGDGLYVTDQAPRDIAPEEIRVLQGTIETANVQPILEMTRMIDVMRSYQRSQNLTKTDHDLKRRAIRDIAAVS